MLRKNMSSKKSSSLLTCWHSGHPFFFATPIQLGPYRSEVPNLVYMYPWGCSGEDAQSGNHFMWRRRFFVWATTETWHDRRWFNSWTENKLEIRRNAQMNGSGSLIRFSSWLLRGNNIHVRFLSRCRVRWPFSVKLLPFLLFLSSHAGRKWL